MQFQKKLLFIGASRYSFKSEQDGNVIEATKINAVDIEQNAEGNDACGHYVSELKADYRLFEQLKNLEPMKYYSFSLDLVMKGNKSTTTVLSVEPKA